MIIKDVIFDFDGTLVDSAPCILNCYELVLREFHLKPKVAISASIIGPPLAETLRVLTGGNESEIGELSERFKHYYDERVAIETLPYTGIFSLLEALQNSEINLYIATNKRTLPTINVIEYLDWHAFFISIRSIDSLALGQQNKSLLLSDMLVEHDININTALYVGDKQDDAIAAKENKLNFLAASWGYGTWDKSAGDILLEPNDLIEQLLLK